MDASGSAGLDGEQGSPTGASLFPRFDIAVDPLQVIRRLPTRALGSLWSLHWHSNSDLFVCSDAWEI
jgi:hypothetical protein